MLFYNLRSIFKEKNESISSVIYKYFNISGKTLDNIINDRHRPFDSTIDKIIDSIHDILSKYERVYIDKNNLRYNFRNKGIKPWIYDEYFSYYHDVVNEVGRLNADVGEYLLKNIENSSGLLGEIISSYGFTETIEKSLIDLKIRKDTPANIKLKLVKISIFLYIISAYEAEYNYNFLCNNEESFFGEYLPHIVNNSIQQPFSIWIKFLIKRHGSGSDEKFSKIIYGPDAPNLENKIRTIKKWKNGQVIPTRKSITIIIERLADIFYSENKEDSEYIKEQGIYAYYIIKSFNIILVELVSFERYGVNKYTVESFFQNYTAWYRKHHKNIQMKNAGKIASI